MTLTTLIRSATFSAAYRYFNPELSVAENKNVFGSLYREHGFGHNFQLEAHLQGQVDGVTGMVLNLSVFDRHLKKVIAPLDHVLLNELPVFAGQVPTPERICQHLHRELEASLLAELPHRADLKLVKVRLYEGDSLWVDYFA